MEPFGTSSSTISSMISSIVLGNPGWSVGVAVILTLFLLLLAAGTLRLPVPPRWKWGLFLLKATAVILLGLCLLEPMQTRRHSKPGENIFVLLADQSASLQVKSATDESASRGDAYKALLTDPASTWIPRLSQDFDVRRYRFGASIENLENFQSLTFNDSSSQLANAIDSLHQRFRGQALAGVFLFTDGNSTDELESVKSEGVRFFPVIPDHVHDLPDIAIDSVSVTQTNFEDAPVTVKAKLSTTGFASEKLPEALTVTLTQHGADTPTKETRTVHRTVHKTGQTNGNGELVATFQVRPPVPGVLFYQLSVASGKSPPVEGAGSPSGFDATDKNNQQLIAVNRDPHVSRILYVGGRPNWEHKFLGRALSEDPQLHLVSLVRIAKKEAKFDFRGRVGESSNPLFRGFKDGSDEETDDYSQPVLVRVNTRDAKELSDGFPKTKAELYQYDALIIDDTEAAFFTRDQLALVERFVSERGGGLLMLGGRDTYQHGKWDHTPVADALPVYLGRRVTPLSGKLKWSLTRDGWLEPWTRSRDQEESEKQRLAVAPPLQILTGTSDIKPGARILASVQNEEGATAPSLVVQTYGQGRVGALLIGDLWKWSLQSPDPKQDDAGKFWRQLSRWLTGDVPQRLSVSLEKTEMEGLPANTLLIKLRDQEFQPRDGDRVLVTVKQPDGNEIKLDAQPSLNAPGTYEAVYVSRQPGSYIATVEASVAANEPQAEPLTTQIGWTSDPAATEFRKTSFNLPALESLAKNSGGEVVRFSDLERLTKDLPSRELAVMETETIPLWHRPWIILIAVSLLALEWGLRRWKGLA